MLDNMTELYGEFGGSTTGGMPAEPGARGDVRGGRQPGGDQDMGGISGDIDPVYVPADVSFEDKVWTDVGIRFKGQMSLGSTWKEGSRKISFKLNFGKFEDENPAIKNQRFYGFDELNLQSGYTDDSLMRDMIVPSIFMESGVPAPYTAFYRIYVDYGEGPVYFGLYTMVESVEDTVIETQFEDDSGNVYKPEGTGATFAQGTFDTGSFEKKTNEGDANWSDVETLYTVLNSEIRTERLRRRGAGHQLPARHRGGQDHLLEQQRMTSILWDQTSGGPGGHIPSCSNPLIPPRQNTSYHAVPGRSLRNSATAQRRTLHAVLSQPDRYLRLGRTRRADRGKRYRHPRRVLPAGRVLHLRRTRRVSLAPSRRSRRPGDA